MVSWFNRPNGTMFWYDTSKFQAVKFVRSPSEGSATGGVTPDSSAWFRVVKVRFEAESVRYIFNVSHACPLRPPHVEYSPRRLKDLSVSYQRPRSFISRYAEWRFGSFDERMGRPRRATTLYAPGRLRRDIYTTRLKSAQISGRA